MLMTSVHLFLARRDLKVPDLAGDYCMVVQFGSEGQVTLSSKPVRAERLLFLPCSIRQTAYSSMAIWF